jgi:glycosyltransferase involved in cell wall biosynthesis
MQEACPLKVREALACGIPVVIAYHDTDLNQVTLDNVLQIPNVEDNVVQNAQRIRQFAREMIGRRVDTNFVASYLDHRKKEADRLAFFERILAGTEGK